ncbi:MAG: hypothetical protein K9L96_04490, partial [Candidatus Omnitrophica bacterium]|nr:hypothetical protein [Candidatus Omnitrophota bacterium]
LPFWNIPLIARMVKRKSSADISLHWALGVWVCFILMAPEAFKSSDLVWKTFNIVNLALFSLVIGVVLYYRRKKFSNKNSND